MSGCCDDFVPSSGSGSTGGGGVNVQNEGVGIAGNPHTTLNFSDVAIVASDAGAGVAAIASNPPYVDLRLPPYNIVANSSLLAVRNQNTAGIKAAIAAFSGTKARLVLPDGDVFVERDVLQWCIKFGTGVSDLTLAGQGMYATSLVQFCVGVGGELDLIVIDGAQRIEICDLGLRQDSITNPDPAQQNHVLCIYNNTAGGTTKNISGHNLFFGKCIGDAIRCLADLNGDEVSGLRFRDITMQLNGVVTSVPPNGRVGARSGIAIQRGVRDAWFHDMTIAGTQNQAIDCEPTGAINPCSDIWFDRMRIDNALGNTGIPVTLGGQATQRTSNITFTNSEIINGQLDIIHTDDCVLDNVVVRSSVPMPVAQTTVLVRQTNNRLQIRNCAFLRTGTTQAGAVFDCENSGNSTTIENCVVVQGTAAVPFHFDITNNLRICNVSINYDGAAPAAKDAVEIFAVNGNADNIQIDNVQLVSSTGVMNSAVGLYVRVGRSALNTRIVNVSCQGSVTRGFLHSATVGTNFDKNPILTGWDIGTVKLWRSEDNGSNQTFTLFPIVGGNHALDSSRILNGDIAPIGNCVGQLGDHYVWRPTTTTSNRYRKATETVAGTPDANGWELIEGSTIAPAALNGTSNNYAPAGVDNAAWIRQDASAASILTGLLVAAASLGNARPIQITNLATNTAFTITLNNEDAASTAGNRFILPNAAPLVIPAGGAVLLAYDLTRSRWTVVSLIPPPTIFTTDLGSGVDGALVFDGASNVTLFGGTAALVPAANVYTLTRDLWATTLSVSVGATIETAGFRIFCQGTCTVNGVIQNRGTAGLNGAAGAGGNTGTAAITSSDASYWLTGVGGLGGSAGAAGLNAIYVAGGATTIGIAAGSAAGAAGGQLQGGGGGNGEGGAGGTTPSPAATAGGKSTGPYNYNDALLGKSVRSAQETYGFAWKTGMGGGGGAGGTAIIGGGGGGGGVPGGVVYLAAPIITGSGSLDVRGSNGGNGQVGGSMNTGGGGGGAGGFVITVTGSSYPLSVTVSVGGGTGGAKNGTGVAGGNGGSGLHIKY